MWSVGIFLVIVFPNEFLWEDYILNYILYILCPLLSFFSQLSAVKVCASNYSIVLGGSCPMCSCISTLPVTQVVFNSPLPLTELQGPLLARFLHSPVWESLCCVPGHWVGFFKPMGLCHSSGWLHSIHFLPHLCQQSVFHFLVFASLMPHCSHFHFSKC